MQEKETSNNENSWRLSLPGIPKLPEDISSLAVKESDLAPLIELFADEASAEELCELVKEP